MGMFSSWVFLMAFGVVLAIAWNLGQTSQYASQPPKYPQYEKLVIDHYKRNHIIHDLGNLECSFDAN